MENKLPRWSFFLDASGIGRGFFGNRILNPCFLLSRGVSAPALISRLFDASTRMLAISIGCRGLIDMPQVCACSAKFPKLQRNSFSRVREKERHSIAEHRRANISPLVSLLLILLLPLLINFGDFRVAVEVTWGLVRDYHAIFIRIIQSELC